MSWRSAETYLPSSPKRRIGPARVNRWSPVTTGVSLNKTASPASPLVYCLNLRPSGYEGNFEVAKRVDLADLAIRHVPLMCRAQRRN